MHRLFIAAVLFGCSSSESENAPVVDAAIDTAPAEAAVDSGKPDTEEPPAMCTLTGACVDEFSAKQKIAATCFGNFGPTCGEFNAGKTVCKWTDGASFEIVAEDAGGSTVVYKSAAGAECFRRRMDGTVIFPDGSRYGTKIGAGAMPKLTVTCGADAGAASFTCGQQECIDCGIDLRTCCF